MARIPLLYLTSSSYSGSTLLAFLLNTHPAICTVSEMIGWRFDEGDDFRCSCGEPLDRCVLFTKIAAAFAQDGLPFRPNDFGTAFAASANEHLNRYLTTRLPQLHCSAMERARDALVWHLPHFGSRLRRIGRANRVFAATALQHSGARIFVDASKNPHRMRHLARIADFDVSVLYLVRDIRGVVVSNMRERANDVRTAARIWLWDQHDILRIASEFARVHTVIYEDLCADVDRELAAIHRFLGVEVMPYPGNFKGSEHHILGNSMRTREISQITPDTKWKSALDAAKLDAICGEAEAFLRDHPGSPAAGVIRRYVNSATVLQPRSEAA